MSQLPRFFLSRFTRFFLTIILLLVIICSAAWLVYQAKYEGRIYRGVSINGISVAGLSAAQALEVVREKSNINRLPHLLLTSGERSWLVSTDDLGGTYYLEPAVAKALRFGRSGSFRQDLGTTLKLLLYGYNIQPELTISPGTLQVLVRELALGTTQPSTSAELLVQGMNITTRKEQAGVEVDYIGTQLAIQQALQAVQGTNGWGRQLQLPLSGILTVQARELSDPEVIRVALVMRGIKPKLGDYQQATDQARILLSRPITLTATLEQIDQAGASSLVTQTWVIDQALLASWLVINEAITAQTESATVSLNKASMQTYLQTLNNQISRPAFEGSYHYNPEQQTFTLLKPAQVGYSLDIPASLELLRKLCFSEERTGELPLRSVQPTIGYDQLQAMLPLSLISSGETQFRGSSAERFQNIRRAAEQFQFVLVPPKATFSFLANLGAVTIANGYSESWVIYGNKTVLGPGGGVCQVATTLFKAVFFGGFPVVERTPHSYRIARYEPPVGLDAAVFSPSTDFKFTNDLDTPIIITNKIDEANGVITFYIYGAPINRRVYITDAATSNPKPSGDPIYEVDLKLAPGESILIEEAHDGIDAVLTRVIEVNGKEVSREQFFSRYSPWPARYRVGPNP